jgi:glycolate oxidase
MMNIAEELTKLLGADQVSADAESLEQNSQDKWFGARATPLAVVYPRNTQEVSNFLKFANAHRLPVTTRTAGTGYVGGSTPNAGDIVLNLSRMNAIKEIHVADGVAVVEPGVITGELQAAVAAKGLFYPPDPASVKECSIGGNIATNAGGPRCMKYGVTRHYLLGLEVVLANGDIVRTGGRTHKNKTGFDLIGLMCGSEGLLGVVTEATLRLLPLPPARATVSCSFPTMPDAAGAVQRVFAAGHLPSAMEIADRFTLDAAREYSGREIHPDARAHLLVDLDGQRESVRHEIEQLRELLLESRAVNLQTALGEAECEELWQIRRDFSYSLRATGLTKLNEDIVVPRGRLVDLTDFTARLQEEYGVPIACFGHAGDGNIHTNVMVDNFDDPGVRRTMMKVLDEIFSQVLDWGGSITGEHGVGQAKKRWWSSATTAELRDVHRTLKNALDPNGILNPGKFIELEGDPSLDRVPEGARLA